MQTALTILVFLIPTIGIIAGLSLAFTIPIFLLLTLYSLKRSIVFTFNYKKYSLEYIFLLWIFLTCFWALKPSESLISFLSLFSLSAIGYILLNHINVLKNNIPARKIEPILFISISCSLLLFYIEIISGGIMSTTFRELFQKKQETHFYLYFLDRGCSLIALLSWVIIAILLKYKQYILSFVFYIIIVITLALSDSLASFVAFISSGLVFIVTRYTCFKNPKIFSILLILASILMVTFAYLINPMKLAKDSNLLPISAKHRLFIWNYVAHKSSEKIIYGWGHSSSRYFPVQKNEMINYKDRTLSPLPMHPHNSILQTFLESGVIGLMLYIAIGCKYLLYIGKNYKSKNELIRNIIASGYSCFSVYLVISVISYNMWQSWWVCSALWVLVMFSWLAYSKEIE